MNERERESYQTRKGKGCEAVNTERNVNRKRNEIDQRKNVDGKRKSNERLKQSKN